MATHATWGLIGLILAAMFLLWPVAMVQNGKSIVYVAAMFGSVVAITFVIIRRTIQRVEREFGVKVFARQPGPEVDEAKG